jgi:hypothetical protein
LTYSRQCAERLADLDKNRRVALPYAQTRLSRTPPAAERPELPSDGRRNISFRETRPRERDELALGVVMHEGEECTSMRDAACAARTAVQAMKIVCICSSPLAFRRAFDGL